MNIVSKIVSIYYLGVDGLINLPRHFLAGWAKDRKIKRNKRWDTFLVSILLIVIDIERYRNNVDAGVVQYYMMLV